MDNFFAENEQLAFCSALVVSGVYYYLDDKLLKTRIFSYADTQRHRLGPNYLQLPVNVPNCAHHYNHPEGLINFMHRDEEISYFLDPFTDKRIDNFKSSPNRINFILVQSIIAKENKHNFKQPGERYCSFAPDRQARYVNRWVEALI
ncbi:hypothetical protein GIB67_038878 [Kingdonia uniflora]|uniref:catalase n=1 Tax=Kingdonia uniflora TaxID=39325 RepID=A0A7J7KVL1_9MAGN|nr:hypothetical protein GIB67_038878 [Kingdonia uniflora]